MSDYHPVVAKIRSFLDEQGITYKAFEHEAVRTSEEAARVRPEYSLSQGCKALIVRIKKKGVPKEAEKVRQSGRLSQEVASDFEVTKNGGNLNSSCKEFVQVVVPGDAKFDPKKVREALNAKDIRFATEDEVKELTDGVEPGGVPPFGNLFGLRVIADAGVFTHEETIFNAGDRRYSMAITTADYKKAVGPLVAEVV